MMRPLIFVAVLASCSPPPRSTEYFIANPVEAERVVAACRKDLHRGAECDNAPAGVAAARSAARMKIYRQTYEDDPLLEQPGARR